MNLVSFNSREEQRRLAFADLGYMGTDVDFDVQEVGASYKLHGETHYIPNRKVLLNGNTGEYISTVGLSLIHI